MVKFTLALHVSFNEKIAFTLHLYHFFSSHRTFQIDNLQQGNSNGCARVAKIDFLEKFWRGGHFRSKKLHLHSFAPSAYWLFIRSVCWYFLNSFPDISSNISLIQLNSKVGGCSTLHWAAISPNPSCTSQFAADAIRTSFNGYSRFSKKWIRFKNLTFSVCLQHVLCLRNFILYLFLKYCSICRPKNQCTPLKTFFVKAIVF